MPIRSLSIAVLALTATAWAQVPSPKEFFGHDVCEDYWLANYKQLSEYWHELDKKSDRMVVRSIGKTEEGREQYMAIISDPANLRHLDDHRKTSRKFAMARDFKSLEEAENAAKKAKSVVWIDGGLHANEVIVAQQLIETAFRLTTKNDEETKRILKDVIILLVHANPDGHDLVADWYMRQSEPTRRSTGQLPRLYQKYIGHDNNRDFYGNTQAETRNMNRVLYSEWNPQILYNHHQTAPQGTIMYIPPFRNPFNYHVDPIVQIGTDVVGMHMHHRLISEGKGGTIMRSGALYSTWWNGGLRTTAYFHNMIGILTETYGTPNPGRINFSANRQIPIADMPLPVQAGPWHFRQSLEYEISANYAILDYASRYREKMLVDTYKMAAGAIEKGRKDTWTRYPSRITQMGANALENPRLRDAKAYVIPADARDSGSVQWFLRRLMDAGVEVDVLTESKGIEGRVVPSGSYVVRCDQPYRAHVLDMFEPQDHPNDFQYPGGPPVPPYDSAGYTLAFQMGVEPIRVLDSVSLPLRSLALGELSAEKNGLGEGDKLDDLNTYLRLNRNLKDGKPAWLTSGVVHLQAGPSSGLAPIELKRRPRVGLWDRYGGSMTSGWTRWIFEKFEFDFSVLFPPDFAKGDLNAKYDAIVLPSGAIPGTLRAPEEPNTDTSIPKEWRERMGSMSAKAVDELRKFVEAGGTLIAIGDSAQNLINPLGLPIKSALVEKDEQGRERNLPNTKFFIPGSVLRVRLNASNLTMGIGDSVDTMFDDSPAWVWKDQSNTGKAEIVGYYDSEKPLRSGWAWGQEKLRDTFAAVRIPMGSGQVVLLGPEVLFRAQPSQTFKLVFNAIFSSASGK